MNKKITIISTEGIAMNGPRILSSYLKKNSFNVQLISLSTFNDRFSESILKNVMELSKNSLLICLSCMSINSKKTIQIIRYLKQLKIPMIWGGIHAILNPKVCLKYTDIVCIGEGEETLLELAIAIQEKKDITKIKNLWIKKKNIIHKNELKSLIRDIDKLPFPDYDFGNQYILINNRIIKMHERYLRYGGHNSSNFLLSKFNYPATSHTIRGCPNNCEFCCNSDLKRIYKNKGNYIRQRSIKNVICELAYLKQKFSKLQFIWFTDDDFFIRDYNKILLFSKCYKERIGLPFMCYVSPLTFNEDKLKLLLETGLTIVELGIQSGSQEVNKKVYNRTYRNDLIFNIGKVFSKYKSKVLLVYQVMCMNPFEGEKDVLQTIKLLQNLPRPFYLQVCSIVFFPGSLIYKKAKKFLDNKSGIENLYFIEYGDHLSHIKLKKKMSLYLNMIILCMNGFNTKYRSGSIPNFLLNFLLSKRMINFNKKFNFINKILLLFPSKGGFFWGIIPPRYKDICLNTKVKIIKFKDRLKYLFRNDSKF